MRLGSAASLLALLLAVLPAEAAKRPVDRVLGLQLGMPKEAAVERLRKFGKLTSEKGEVAATRQRWELSDKSYAHLVIQYDSQRRVQWISAFARPGGRAIRYRDLGDLDQARKSGDYIYVWSVPARDAHDPYQVIARGHDPEIIESLSLARVTRPVKPTP